MSEPRGDGSCPATRGSVLIVADIGRGQVRYLSRRAGRRPAQHPSRRYQHQTSHLTKEEETMTSERVLDVMVRRHVFTTDRPFARVLDGIFSGISQMQSRCGYLTPV